ncbi:class I SAM-dependent methyltransferase [Rhodococcus qingshengii]|uniref:Methyltransferase domain-containing protein n=1 Tax=Rhodococcus erythropolis TaxID=1833 RepID=A0A6G9D3X6_RHOER|nr:MULTISPECIES: class I SAM-dependent methyltransferase [Rhodococcus]EQM29783.1 hypothetical protein N601_31100 [Rhodococcus erythropolis DN1]MDV8015959.1 class I SAM-dependent methyltransferase [Rhodococcus sp. IEGM 1241]QIP43770.1 hypothetical protein G9444_6527 [Rhodococcus erythropolis]BBE49316.1 hypothetical protein RE2895_62470 [Rhodococcus erythropolis]
MDSSSAWDARYSSVEHPWGSAPAAALSARFAELTPGRAVDLGCGDGRHARWLADSGWAVDAVDFSSVAIELAMSGGSDKSIRYSVADARTWEPSGPVDLVAIGFLHLPVDELVAVIASAATWLAPGGEAAVSRTCAREFHSRCGRSTGPIDTARYLRSRPGSKRTAGS